MAHIDRSVPDLNAAALAALYVENGGALRGLTEFVERIPERLRKSVASLIEALLDDPEARWRKGTSLDLIKD